jgi:hypothetical protein
MSIFLNRTPTLLVFEITGNVPQLKLEFSERSNRRWWVSLMLNNAAALRWSICLRRSLGHFAYNVCDSGLARLLWPYNQNFYNAAHIFKLFTKQLISLCPLLQLSIEPLSFPLIALDINHDSTTVLDSVFPLTPVPATIRVSVDS